jgi:3-dehydroquinate synthetase
MMAAQGLPTRLQDVDLEAIIFATARDKKRVGGGPVPFVLCQAPGRPLLGQTVAPGDLRGAINELIAA